MFVLVSGSGENERIYVKGMQFEFVLRNNKKVRFKGRLFSITELGMVVLDNLKVWSDGKYRDFDGSFKLGVYEFLDYRKSKGIAYKFPLALLDVSGMSLGLCGDAMFSLGDSISLKWRTSVSRKVCSGVYVGVNGEGRVALRDYSVVEYLDIAGEGSKVEKGERLEVDIKKVEKVWYVGRGRKKHKPALCIIRKE